MKKEYILGCTAGKQIYDYNTMLTFTVIFALVLLTVPFTNQIADACDGMPYTVA